MGRIQNQARAEGRVDPITSAVRWTVSPLASPIADAWDGAIDFLAGVAEGPALRQEVRRLRSIARAAELYRVREAALIREIDGLRSLSKLRNFGRSPVFARVVGLFPYENRITLDVGSAQGVRPGMAVLAQGGLLAVVQTTEPRRAQALLLVSPAQRVGAMVERTPPIAGLVRGDAADRLVLDFMDREGPLEVGDWVTTSGFSDMIPGGIPIGRVVRVEIDPTFGSRRARVAPSALIDAVREVAVLR